MEWFLKVLLQVKLHSHTWNIHWSWFVSTVHWRLFRNFVFSSLVLLQQLHFVALTLLLSEAGGFTNNNTIKIKNCFSYGYCLRTTFRAFWKIYATVVVILSLTVETAESSFSELKIIYYKQFEHHQGTRDAVRICQMVSWEQKLDLGYSWWLCTAHGAGALQIGA